MEWAGVVDMELVEAEDMQLARAYNILVVVVVVYKWVFELAVVLELVRNAQAFEL